MAIGFISNQQGQSSGTNTFTAFSTIGANILIVGICYTASGNTVAVSDNQSNTWNSLTLFSGTAACRLFYAMNLKTNASHSVTVTATGTPNWGGVVAAFSNVANTAAFDVQNGATGTPTLSSGSITPTNNNELIVTFYGNLTNTTTPTTPAGFTIVNSLGASGSNSGFGMAYVVQTTKAAVSASWAVTGSTGQGAATIASFNLFIPGFPMVGGQRDPIVLTRPKMIAYKNRSIEPHGYRRRISGLLEPV